MNRAQSTSGEQPQYCPEHGGRLCPECGVCPAEPEPHRATCSRRGHVHTPGPWKVGGHPNDGSGSDWREIVSLGTEFSPSFIGTALRGNAYLIAAAPELLERLVECVKVIRQLDRSGTAHPAVELAEQVIQKAKGAQ